MTGLEITLDEVGGVTVGELNTDEMGESCDEPKLELESDGVRQCLSQELVAGDRSCKSSCGVSPSVGALLLRPDSATPCLPDRPPTLGLPRAVARMSCIDLNSLKGGRGSLRGSERPGSNSEGLLEGGLQTVFRLAPIAGMSIPSWWSLGSEVLGLFGWGGEELED